MQKPMVALVALCAAWLVKADTIVSITENTTYTRDQIVANDARFEIAEGAVLTLYLDQDLLCKGATGKGKLVKVGPAQLEFTNPASGNQADGGVEIQVNEGRLKFTEASIGTATITLGANGALDNYGWPSFNGTLTVHNETDKTIFTNSGYYSARLYGDGSFVKTGAGALTVESYFSINGSIRIDEGLLVFNKAISRDRGTLAGISGDGWYKLAYAGLTDTFPANGPLLLNYFNFNGDETDRGIKPLSGGQASDDASRYEATDRGKAVQVIESGVMTAMYCDNATLGTDSFTILARAKTQKQDKTVLFSYGRRDDGAIGFRTDANGNVQFAAWKSGAITSESAYATVVDPTTRYHLYAMVYDSAAQTMSFYADGALVETVAYSLAIAGSKFQLGAIHGGTDGADSNKSTEVYLDELRTYTGAMTASEVATWAGTMPIWPSLRNTWRNTAGDAAWDNVANWSDGRLPAADEVFDVVIDEGVTLVYETTANTSLTATFSGKGTFKKTGSAQLTLNNGGSGRIAEGGVTLEIAEGKLLCNNGAGDPAFGAVTFVLGEDESAQLDNFGWMDFYGTVTLVSTTEKTVFNNNGHNGGGTASVRQNGKIVKDGTGTIVFKARLNQAPNAIEVKAGTFVLSLAKDLGYTYSGTVSGAGRFVKKGTDTLIMSGPQSMTGGLEIAEGSVELWSESTSTICGIYGPGTLVKGTGLLRVGRGPDNASLKGATLKLNAGTAQFGENGFADGALLQDSTIIFDGGTFTGWGWPNVVNVTFDCRQDATIFEGTNTGHSISNGRFTKTGSGTLTVNAHLKGTTAVTLAEGVMSVLIARWIEAGVTVVPAEEVAEKYRVKMVEDGYARSFYLDRRGGFTVIVQ